MKRKLQAKKDIYIYIYIYIYTHTHWGRRDYFSFFFHESLLKYHNQTKDFDIKVYFDI